MDGNYPNVGTTRVERSAKKRMRMNSSGPILGCNPSALKCGKFKKGTREAIKDKIATKTHCSFGC